VKMDLPTPLHLPMPVDAPVTIANCPAMLVLQLITFRFSPLMNASPQRSYFHYLPDL